ncbi:MAG: cellulase family glycosylhydrolase [Verrucomicrobiota bacterium]
MKSILTLLLASITMTSLAADDSSKPPIFTNPAGFMVHRGVNLSHWLSQDFGWEPKSTFLTEKDIQFIADAGYDFVRIPIDEPELWSADGTPSKENFERLRDCLDWCAKYRLRAIVDLHILRAHHFNADNGEGKMTLWTDPAAQENFLKLWRDISDRVKSYPISQVAYELMNEPVAPDPEDWNQLIARATQSIRERERDRVIVIGPNRWQTPDNFPVLKVPAHDPNILLSFHTYAPLLFTHHLADWTSFKDFTAPVHYPGRVASAADISKAMSSTNAGPAGPYEEGSMVWDKKKLAELVAPAVAKSRQLKLPVMCGEFGCLATVDRQQRLQYYRDIVSVFEAGGIAWCNWEYKGDFGVYEFDVKSKKSGKPDQGLIDALMLKP